MKTNAEMLKKTLLLIPVNNTTPTCTSGTEMILSLKYFAVKPRFSHSSEALTASGCSI